MIERLINRVVRSEKAFEEDTARVIREAVRMKLIWSLIECSSAWQVLSDEQVYVE